MGNLGEMRSVMMEGMELVEKKEGKRGDELKQDVR